MNACKLAVTVLLCVQEQTVLLKKWGKWSSHRGKIFSKGQFYRCRYWRTIYCLNLFLNTHLANTIKTMTINIVVNSGMHSSQL